MRIFVTGASGFVGSAVVEELIGTGHSVLGLARSDAAAAALTKAGVAVHRGSLDDLDSLRRGADAAEGVIHTAFIHDFSKFKENCETDRRAIGAMSDALAGSDRPLVITSGTGLVASGELATETSEPGAVNPRAASEQAAMAAAERGVRVAIMRLPPSVHGAGDHGFVPLLINIAREKGIAAYIGDGLNRWPAVNRADAAALYRLVAEKAEAGARYHAVDETGIAHKDIAATIGRHLKLPVKNITREQAAEHFGWFAHFAGLDNPSSSTWTRQQLGWQPKGPGLLDDMERANYFAV